jgi:hypothetical protein
MTTATYQTTSYGLPVATDTGIRCANHWDGQRIRHENVDAVRACYAITRDLADQQASECWAEDAWLRAAEAGTPDTWREDDIARMAEALGYGPPPGWDFLGKQAPEGTNRHGVLLYQVEGPEGPAPPERGPVWPPPPPPLA